MFKRKNVDIVNGDLFKSIIIYAIPIMFIKLIQSLFNSVDIIVLGNVADTNAVAAVGATGPIISLIVDTFFGISAGARIVLARLVGEGSVMRVKKTVSTSLITATALGTVIAIVGIVFAEWFLVVSKCPAECFAGAKIYVQLYVAAAPAILIYNFGTAVLNVSGDTRRPLYYMMISGLVNVILNVILCLVLPQKVAAVAIATAVSQILGAFLIMRRVCTMDGICRFSFKEIYFSKSAFRKIMYNGIPIGITHAFYPFSNLQIQSQINALGPAVMAGSTAMANLEGIVSAIVSAPYSMAASVFAGQNLGAKKNDRVKKSIIYCLGISVGLGIVLAILSIWFTKPLAALYVAGDEAAVVAALIRRKYILGMYFIACFNGIMSAILQAFGYSIFTTANTIFSVLLFRIFWTGVVYPSYQNFDCLCLCFTVSWTLTAIFNTAFFFYVYKFKFKKGKIKKM